MERCKARRAERPVRPRRKAETKVRLAALRPPRSSGQGVNRRPASRGHRRTISRGIFPRRRRRAAPPAVMHARIAPHPFRSLWISCPNLSACRLPTPPQRKGVHARLRRAMQGRGADRLRGQIVTPRPVRKRFPSEHTQPRTTQSGRRRPGGLRVWVCDHAMRSAKGMNDETTKTERQQNGRRRRSGPGGHRRIPL